MDRVMEKAENILKKIISCRLLYYIAIMLLFVGTYYIELNKKIESQNLGGGNHFTYFLICASISGILVLLLIIFSKKLYEKIQPHIIYIILSLIIGGMYVFIIPLCNQSDEPAHLYRAFQVAEGEIISPQKDGAFVAKLPKSIEEMVQVNSENKKREYKKYYDIKEMMEIPLNEEETTEIVTIGNYLGVSYFPHVIGIKTGMLLNLNPYYSAMLGRITGLITTVLLFGLAIKKLPKHKLFASIILLSPVALSYSASISADSLLLAASLLMFSYVLYYMHTKEKVKKLDYVILAILTFILAISKMAYVPIIGILMFIPKDCFKNSKVKWGLIASLILLGLISTIWWMNTANIDVSIGDENYTNIWIYKKPLSYLIVLFRTTINNAYSYIENAFAGHFLCHNQVNPYAVVPLAYIAISIIAFFSDENKTKTTMLQKLITTGIIVMVYVLVSTAMYVYNTSYKNDLIIGVQGRYFLPLILMAMFFANNKKIEIKEERLTNIALISNYAVYLAMMTTFFI